MLPLPPRILGGCVCFEHVKSPVAVSSSSPPRGRRNARPCPGAAAPEQRVATAAPQPDAHTPARLSLTRTERWKSGWKEGGGRSPNRLEAGVAPGRAGRTTPHSQGARLGFHPPVLARPINNVSGVRHQAMPTHTSAVQPTTGRQQSALQLLHAAWRMEAIHSLSVTCVAKPQPVCRGTTGPGRSAVGM